MHLDLDNIRALVAKDLMAVDHMIAERASSRVQLVSQVTSHITNSGGKRLRPLMLLLAAHACEYSGNAHLALATAIEYIHTATLLHDDVVDQSTLRRGQETANYVWGNEASILVGDFLYSRAFELLVSAHNTHVLDIMAAATAIIAEGEAFQLTNRHNPNITELDYLHTIHCKTGKLFETAAQLGAAVSHAPTHYEQTLKTYGMHVGTAFQLIDDVLDYSAEEETMGKHVGDDLAEGSPTLPLLYAMENGTPAESTLIRTAIEAGGIEHLSTIQQAIASTGAIEYTLQRAKEQVEKAVHIVQDLPPSPYRDGLIALAQFTVARTF
jgi:octaprenyl-diphosphate synthase